MVWSFRNMMSAVIILTSLVSTGIAQQVESRDQMADQLLWSDLFHPDYETAEKAARTLLKSNAGLDKVYWQTARLVPNADQETREKLAKQLSEKPFETVDQGLIQLSNSTEPEVRKLVLLSAEGRKASDELKSRITEMAANDPSPLVRGYADLLDIGKVKETENTVQSTVEHVEEATKTAANEVKAAVEETKTEAKMLITETKATVEKAAQFQPGLAAASDDANAWAAGLAEKVPVTPIPAVEPVNTPVVTTSQKEVQTPKVSGSMSFKQFLNLGQADSSIGVPPEPPETSEIQTTAASANVTENYDPEVAIPLTLPAEELAAPKTAMVDDEGLPSPNASPLPGDEVQEELNPGILERPLDQVGQPIEETMPSDVFKEDPNTMFTLPFDTTPGYSGMSGIRSTEVQENSHFVPVEDRWRLGQPTYDRYGKGHEPGHDDYLYVKGHWWDPYNQNVLKGDFPIIGQHTFLNLEFEALMIHAYQQVPTPTTPFESTTTPGQEKLFGDPNSYFTTNFFAMTIDLFHGNAGFKQPEWQLVAQPVFNFNYLDTNELGLVNPDVREGTTRNDQYLALEEWFMELKLADTSPHYDFTSVRIGSQPFQSDFRGHIFSDINRGVRFFGTRNANRDQWNVAFFDQVEKDTNSTLNTFEDRPQRTIIANYYRQDFIWPGYTTNVSYHYNHERPSFRFDENNFLVRPDPTGVFKPHRVQAHYFGWTGEGHIDVINISHAFYWAVGHDGQNPIAGTSQDINAQLGALELSIDRDWVKFRGSFFWASGDNDPNDGDATGFSTILDNPQFAGGEFSYFQRNRIGLFGGAISQVESLVPDLRTSKFQGQSNFVNPGLLLINAGMDFEVTPKFRVITNANYIWFEETQVLETFTFQDDIDRRVGLDLSVGIEWRPQLSDNIVIEAGYSTLIPGQGFRDLYGQYDPFTIANSKNESIDSLHSVFCKTELIW